MLPYPVLLLLLAALTAVSSSRPGTIDWAECKAEEALCFADAKCSGNTRLFDEDSQLDQYDLHFDASCAEGISIRAFTDKMWLVRMQVTRKKFDPAAGLQFYMGNDLFLSCKAENGTVKIEGKEALNAVAYGSDSRLTTEGAFCSFLINDATSLSELMDRIKIEFWHSSNKAELISPSIVSLHRYVFKFFVFCNPLSLNANLNKTTIGYRKVKIPNILSFTIGCSEIMDSARRGVKLIVRTEFGTEVATNFICNKTEKKYTYEQSGQIYGFNPEHEVFCGIPIEKACPNLPAKASASEREVIRPSFYRDDAFNTFLKCDNKDYPNMKMMIGNGYFRGFYFAGEATCKNSLTVANAAAWFAHNSTSGKEQQFDTAECTNQTSCTLGRGDYFTSVAPRIRNLTTANATVRFEDIICTNSSYSLQVIVSGGHTPLNTSEIYCNFTSGYYTFIYERGREIIGERAYVYCALIVPEPPEPPPVAAIVGGTTAGIGVLCLVAVIVFYCVINRRWKSEDERRALAWSQLPPIIKKRRVRPKRKAPAKKKAVKVGPQIGNFPDSWKEDVYDINKPRLFKATVQTWRDTILFPYNYRIQYIEYILGLSMSRKVNIVKFMTVLDVMFANELDIRVWKRILPFFFYLERTLFHSAIRSESACYGHLRMYLIRRLEKVLSKFDGGYGSDCFKDDEEPGKGFVRGLAYLILYKLNLEDAPARHAIVERVITLFNRNGMSRKDPSRMFIWGILHLEESGWKREFGRRHTPMLEQKKENMHKYLLKEFNKLLKEKSIMNLAPEGSKMEHVLFAMGCTPGRKNLRKVFIVMRKDLRFKPRDYMAVMYGRDWAWDGAWSSICHEPNDHDAFCDFFTQRCPEYHDLAEMCIRYWEDKYSREAAKGRNFWGIMQQYSKNFGFRGRSIKALYRYYDRVENRLGSYSVDIITWIDELYAFTDLLRDPRNFTPSEAERRETRQQTSTMRGTDSRVSTRSTARESAKEGRNTMSLCPTEREGGPATTREASGARDETSKKSRR